MNYQKEAKEWEKQYESLPFKNGLYAPLFKRGVNESDEEYVKHCEEVSTLMCCLGLCSTGDKEIQKKVADYIDSHYNIENELLELMKLDAENKCQNYTSKELDGFQKIQLPLGAKNEHTNTL